MKKLTFILAIIIFSGCDDPISPSSELIGSWAWVQSTGGIVGITDTPASTGEHIFIEITKSRFKKYVNDSLVEELEYTISHGPSIYQTEEAPIITFENGGKQSFSLDDSLLILRDECYDCFQYEYVKSNQN